VFDGQSFNHKPDAAASDQPYNVRLMTLLASPTRRYGMANMAISGTSYTDRSTTVVSRVDQFATRYAKAVIVDFSGVKDISEGKTAAEILALAEGYADARRAAGFSKVLTATVTANSGYTAPQEAVRVAYNALLVANANRKFDAVIDIASLPHAADPANTTYYTDGIHPSNALAAEFAQLAYTALATARVV
jgi:hypothetical protein